MLDGMLGELGVTRNGVLLVVVVVVVHGGSGGICGGGIRRKETGSPGPLSKIISKKTDAHPQPGKSETSNALLQPKNYRELLKTFRRSTVLSRKKSISAHLGKGRGNFN